MILAAAGVYLGLAHPDNVQAATAFLPEMYAAALAGYLFWRRSRSANGRERLFWWLWAAGFVLFMASDALGLLEWSQPLGSRMEVLSLTFTFLPEVAMMGALVIQPEVREGELRDPVVGHEAALVALWWVYLYLVFVTPWRAISASPTRFWASFVGLHNAQNIALVVWLAWLGLSTDGRWRRCYLNLAGAVGLLSATIGPMYQDLDSRLPKPTMIFEALVSCAFLWMALGPTIAGNEREAAPEPAKMRSPELGAGGWLASLTALGIPVLAIWLRFQRSEPEPIRHYQLMVSFATLIASAWIIYQWQVVSDQHGEQLVVQLENSVRGVSRLQGRFAEAEKLVSLGHLAAGAAHEINNPVAAMLGYAELIRADAGASERTRELGRKIGEQARRIRTLVHNLLSLGEQASFEVQPVDVSKLVESAADLRRLSGRQTAESRLTFEAQPAQVRGDPDKLLQVFYRLLLALSGNGDGSTAEVSVRTESGGKQVVVEFCQRPGETPSTPEIYNAQKAQSGEGLSLGVCYAIVKEHGGALLHENLSDGRRRFRVELPALDGNSPAWPNPAA